MDGSHCGVDHIDDIDHPLFADGNGKGPAEFPFIHSHLANGFDDPVFSQIEDQNTVVAIVHHVGQPSFVVDSDIHRSRRLPPLPLGKGDLPQMLTFG